MTARKFLFELASHHSDTFVCYVLVAPMLPCRTIIFVQREKVCLDSINLQSIFISFNFDKVLLNASNSMNNTNYEANGTS